MPGRVCVMGCQRGVGRLGAVGIAAVALAMVLADMQFEERAAREAQTAKRQAGFRVPVMSSSLRSKSS